ncbi:hypothetical protein GETHOR_02080 [Geothrix oryzae]|uniref:Plastocyanin n=1 Tax=Geothrix oryzae TaxID=2927975 RepID=A0ABM8DMJ6_9BACT|nr:hypothetical protein [Geothrix oryzae]BDU68107.1 hypothetical protein GETHOR_02080 [Geothrix oryzae]
MSRIRGLLLLAAAWPILAGELKGPVTILRKDGRRLEALADGLAMLEPLGPKPRLEKRPLTRIRTLGKRFVPRVSWTTPGSEVAFPNLDHILHNVFSPCCANPFDTGTYRPGDSPRITVQKPGLVKLYCNVHNGMNAFLWVVETPWVQPLDARAGLDFRELPPGPYRLRIWHPETGEKVWMVSIGEGTTRGGWTLSATLPALEPHKNKFGQDYPPAKDESSY